VDADRYDSTKCVLGNLAERVFCGGLIVIDNYYTWEGCTIAVNEFAARNKRRIRQNPLHGVCYIMVYVTGTDFDDMQRYLLTPDLKTTRRPSIVA
jgi:hypothetical protein